MTNEWLLGRKAMMRGIRHDRSIADRACSGTWAWRKTKKSLGCMKSRLHQ